MRLFDGEKRRLKRQLRAYSFFGDVEIDLYECGNCSLQHPRARALVCREGRAYATYNATGGKTADVQFEVTLLRRTPGTVELSNDVTFVVRSGKAADNVQQSYSLIGTHVVGKDGELTDLTHEEGLEHPRIAELWPVVEWLYLTDPLSHQVFHHGHTVTADNWPSFPEHGSHYVLKVGTEPGVPNPAATMKVRVSGPGVDAGPGFGGA